MNIPIGLVKDWRESIDATHLVVFAVGRDGQQHVATHGETEQNAKEAAKTGNKLKVALGWPEDLCRAKPLERKCKNCTYYKPDYGTHCFNGWSGDGSHGHCLYQSSPRVPTTQDDKCSNFEPKS
ncbi:MAG: hypothetical protein SVK08_02430 [Halobacteriota archaeon]|nr:hypothetical protein [Halobacteriota archaeon]